MSSELFIGKKPIGFYIPIVLHYIKKKNSVTLVARGNYISKACSIAEIISKNTGRELDISLFSDELVSESNAKIPVTGIKIKITERFKNNKSDIGGDKDD